nr:ABC transporter ATP-binding protein [Lachnospiraceae bacterium]
MSSPLEVKGLRVDFKVGKNKYVTAVKDINLSIERGKTLGIVGESGCGKSVTANAIMQLLPKGIGSIEAGSILLDGQDITKCTPDEIRQIRGKKISMIFQDPMTALNPVYTVGNQLIEMLRVHQKISRKDAFEYSVKMLEKVGIPSPRERMKEYPHQLSGGMRQRVMIAMALSTEPEVLIADEPTTALDVTIQAQILELINQLKVKTNTAVMLITHDMGVIAESADDVMVMYGGEVVEYDEVVPLFENPMHPYTRDLLNSIPRLDEDREELYSIKGTVPGLADMPKGCHFSTRCTECTNKCKTRKPPTVQIGGKLVKCWKYTDREDTTDE